MLVIVDFIADMVKNWKINNWYGFLTIKLDRNDHLDLKQPMCSNIPDVFILWPFCYFLCSRPPIMWVDMTCH